MGFVQGSQVEGKNQGEWNDGHIGHKVGGGKPLLNLFVNFLLQLTTLTSTTLHITRS